MPSLMHTYAYCLRGVVQEEARAAGQGPPEQRQANSSAGATAGRQSAAGSSAVVAIGAQDTVEAMDAVVRPA